MAAPTVYVVPIPGCDQEVHTLMATVRAMGCRIVCDGDPLSDYSRCIQAANFVLLPLCEAASKNGLLEKLLVDVRSIGGKIIGVWPKEVADGRALPPALQTFGHSVVRADREELEKVIVDGERVWLEPDGKPRKAPRTPRHKGKTPRTPRRTGKA